MKLVKKSDGSELHKGDIVEDFRGDKHILVGWSKPRHSGSTGRVHIKEVTKDWDAEYYPSVIGAEFVED